MDTIPEPKPVITFDEFYNALVATDELLSRCQILYVCRGNTLDVITGETAQFTNPLELATLRQEVTEYAYATLNTFTKPVYERQEGLITKIILPMGIIKVEMRVLDGNYRPIKNFDLKFFNYDVWKIPNPIDEFNRIMEKIYG